MCVLIFLQFLSETFLILRRIQSDGITNLHVKYPMFLADYIQT